MNDFKSYDFSRQNTRVTFGELKTNVVNSRKKSLILFLTQAITFSKDPL